MKYTAIILCIYNQKRNKNINLVMGHKDNTITAGAFALNKKMISGGKMWHRFQQFPADYTLLPFELLQVAL